MAKTAKLNIKGTIVSDEDKWIYDWLGISATSPKDVTTFIEGLSGEDLEIDINSPGGDVFAGDEMYTAIRRYTGNVIINCVGLAGSIASLLLTASKSRISPPAMVMIHNASGSARGDYHTMDKTSEILQKVNEAICNAYIEKTGMTKENLLALMDKELWMTAEEAIKYGFVDEIMENQNQNHNKVTSALSNRSSMSIYNSTPVLDRETIEKFRNSMRANNIPENNVPIVRNHNDDNMEHFFNNKNNKKKEGNKMAADGTINDISNIEELTASYPTLVQQIINSARLEATNEERNRLQAIDEIAATLTDEIVNEAKYVNPVTAEALALQALKTNSQIGNKVLTNMVTEIENSGADGLKPDANAGIGTLNEDQKEAKVKNLASKFSRKK